MLKNKIKPNFNTARMMITTFLGLIIFGALILMLPISSATHQWTDGVTALFTSTTSVCVTGLVVVPTFAHWSLFGKIIILILIQLGGLGLICIASGLLMMVGKRISLKQKRLIQEYYNMDTGVGVREHIRGVFRGTFLIELIGAMLYSIRFIPKFGVLKGVWYSVFHAVSAFCNAGIDILGDNSLMDYKTDPLIMFTTIGLIVTGGIGFIVWWEVLRLTKKVIRKEILFRRIPERLSLHAKIVFTMTLFLIVFGAAFTFAVEYNNPETIGNMDLGGKIIASLFQSVTLRTAGFATISQGSFRATTFIIFCLMMLVGGSPMGTAGGIKTTTLAMIFLEAKSVIKGGETPKAFKRRINAANVKTALAIMIVALAIAFSAITILSITENASLRVLGYEVFSAVGTVGLSMDYTAELSTIGRLVIIVLMFIGRIGPMSLVVALTHKETVSEKGAKLPEKNIIIG